MKPSSWATLSRLPLRVPRHVSGRVLDELVLVKRAELGPVETVATAPEILRAYGLPSGVFRTGAKHLLT